ncbi:MAG: hypothetical protein K2M12_08690 [Muribaculaceae bacterium]|nr:hypothetical protein [Muribaculaceae bacterium]
MKHDTDILDKIARNDGLKAPDGYFGDFARRMAEQLPDRPELQQMGVVIPPRTMWERVRPYVYMAAMFAGVWCMLKMFTGITASDSLTPMENNPIMAEAFGNEYFMNHYVLDEVSYNDVVEDLVQDGISADSLNFETLFAE